MVCPTMGSFFEMNYMFFVTPANSSVQPRESFWVPDFSGMTSLFIYPESNMKTRLAKTLIATFIPLAAFAHTSQGNHGFFDDFAHPFFGADHLPAMLLVGAWSVLNARHIWIAPLTFVAMLALGAAIGRNGIVVPQLEPLLAASVLIIG